jgi:hypothetical protein
MVQWSIVHGLHFFNSNNTLLTISSTCVSMELGAEGAGREEAPPVKARRWAGSSVDPGEKAASGAVRIS